MAKKTTLICNGKKLEIVPLKNELFGKQSSSFPEPKAPGQGSFEISTPQLSAENISLVETISCKVTITGKNISQIASELMIQAGKFMVGPVQSKLLKSPKSREINGITHPHWEFNNEIEFEIKPAGRLLYCGSGFTLACMIPERYGADKDTQIWSLEGVYQRGGGEPFRAKFEFDHQGSLVRKTGFYPTSTGGVAAPFELLIEDGDTYEPNVTLINDKGEIGKGKMNPIMLGGGNLLHWEPMDACPGLYHIGVVVTDFDGQSTRVYTSFSIKDA